MDLKLANPKVRMQTAVEFIMSDKFEEAIIR